MHKSLFIMKTPHFEFIFSFFIYGNAQVFSSIIYLPYYFFDQRKGGLVLSNDITCSMYLTIQSLL